MGLLSTRSKFREGDMKRVEAALVSLCSKMAREGETGWDAQLRKLCVATVEAVGGSGQAGGRPPNLVQGSRIMPPLELTNSRTGRQLPVTQLTNSRQGQARQDHQSDVVQRLANAFANQELGISDNEPVDANAVTSRHNASIYNIFLDDNSGAH
jgi:hypothetical protein